MCSPEHPSPGVVVWELGTCLPLAIIAAAQHDAVLGLSLPLGTQQRAGPAASEHSLHHQGHRYFTLLNFLQPPSLCGGPCAVLLPSSLMGPVHPGGSGHMPCPQRCPNGGRRAGAVQRSVAKQPSEQLCCGETSDGNATAVFSSTG